MDEPFWMLVWFVVLSILFGAEVFCLSRDAFVCAVFVFALMVAVVEGRDRIGDCTDLTDRR